MVPGPTMHLGVDLSPYTLFFLERKFRIWIFFFPEVSQGNVTLFLLLHGIKRKRPVLGV
jgi:hypothetical protein